MLFKHEKPKRIFGTEVNPEDVLQFSLNHHQYCAAELSEYFDFSVVLRYVDETVGSKTIGNVSISIVHPKKH